MALIQANTDMAASPPASREFILFPKLPVELQIIVWELASIDPSVLQVSLSWVRDKNDPNNSHYKVFTKKKPSGLLLARRLARETLLKTLTGCIRHHQKIIRFNPDTDYIMPYLHYPDEDIAVFRKEIGRKMLFETSLPSPSSNGRLIPYSALFSDVKNLLLPEDYLRSDRGASSSPISRHYGANVRADLLFQFKSLKNLFVVKRDNRHAFDPEDPRPNGAYYFAFAAQNGHELVMVEHPEQDWAEANPTRAVKLEVKLGKLSNELSGQVIREDCGWWAMVNRGRSLEELGWEMPAVKPCLLRGRDEDLEKKSEKSKEEAKRIEKHRNSWLEFNGF